MKRPGQGESKSSLDRNKILVAIVLSVIAALFFLLGKPSISLSNFEDVRLGMSAKQADAAMVMYPDVKRQNFWVYYEDYSRGSARSVVRFGGTETYVIWFRDGRVSGKKQYHGKRLIADIPDAPPQKAGP